MTNPSSVARRLRVFCEPDCGDEGAEKIRKSEEGLNRPEARAALILRELVDACIERVDSTVATPGFEEALVRVHSPAYLTFLKDAFESAETHGDADWYDPVAETLNPNHFRRFAGEPPSCLPAYKLSGHYGSDLMTPIRRDTYSTVVNSARIAHLAAAKAVSDPECVAYALVRSPGHHAGRSRYGGFCFLNNAAVAATRLLDVGHVGILDLDFHAGDGTYDVFGLVPDECDENRVFAVSLHADPMLEYPSFAGFENETGCDDRCLNIPLPGGTDLKVYLAALTRAVSFLREKKVRSLVIAFGADTYARDFEANPVARFSLFVEDYRLVGDAIREAFASDLPVVVTQEGGYALDAVGPIVRSFFAGLCPFGATKDIGLV